MTTTRAILVAVLLATSCVSAEKADEKWDDFVAEHNACETADDCVLVYPGCPLGCHTAVAKEHEAAAIAKADKLVKSYERGGRACAYGCIEAGELTCEQGACTVAELAEPQ